MVAQRFGKNAMNSLDTGIAGNETMLCGVCVEPGTFDLRDAPVPTEAPEGWALVDI